MAKLNEIILSYAWYFTGVVKVPENYKKANFVRMQCYKKLTRYCQNDITNTS